MRHFLPVFKGRGIRGAEAMKKSQEDSAAPEEVKFVLNILGNMYGACPSSIEEAKNMTDLRTSPAIGSYCWIYGIAHLTELLKDEYGEARLPDYAEGLIELEGNMHIASEMLGKRLKRTLKRLKDKGLYAETPMDITMPDEYDDDGIPGDNGVDWVEIREMIDRVCNCRFYKEKDMEITDEEWMCAIELGTAIRRPDAFHDASVTNLAVFFPETLPYIYISVLLIHAYRMLEEKEKVEMLQEDAVEECERLRRKCRKLSRMVREGGGSRKDEMEKRMRALKKNLKLESDYSEAAQGLETDL